MRGMEVLHWAGGHGFDLLEAAGIIASLCFTAVALLREDRSRRISNLLALTANHRDIWMQLYTRPELTRVIEREVDLKAHPVTNDEALFMTFLLHHLGATYRAMREGMFATEQAIEGDIAWFLRLPIPNAVWQRSKAFLEPDFVVFVERGLKGSGGQ